MIFPIQKPYQAMQQTNLADISQVGLLSFLISPGCQPNALVCALHLYETILKKKKEETKTRQVESSREVDST